MPNSENFSATRWPLSQIVERLAALLGRARRRAGRRSTAGSPTATSAPASAAATCVVRLPGKDTELLGIDRAAERDGERCAAAAVGVAPGGGGDARRPALPRHRVRRGRADGAPPTCASRRRWPRSPRALRALHGCGRDRRQLRRLPDRRGLRGERRAARGAERARRPTSAAHAAAAPDRGRAGRRPSTSRCSATTTSSPPTSSARADGLRIVDWEYAGMGDRYFDLGNFAVNNELDDAEEDGASSTPTSSEPPTPRRLATLRLMRFMSDFREAMWGVVAGHALRPRLRLRRLRRQALRAAARDRRRPALRGLAGGGAWRRGLSCPTRARCVIVGGGVGGTSLAYHLAKLGWDDVVLLERSAAHLGLDLPLAPAWSASCAARSR